MLNGRLLSSHEEVKAARAAILTTGDHLLDGQFYILIQRSGEECLTALGKREKTNAFCVLSTCTEPSPHSVY